MPVAIPSRFNGLEEVKQEKKNTAASLGFSLASASRDGNADQVRALLKTGASVNWGQGTPLHWACQRGRTDCVRLLLNAHADYKATHKDDGRNALHYAAAKGHVECVTLLLSKGARDDTADLNGRKAFHLAYINGHIGVVELLSAAAEEEAEQDKLRERQEMLAPVEVDGATVDLAARPPSSVKSAATPARTPARAATPPRAATPNKRGGPSPKR